MEIGKGPRPLALVVEDVTIVRGVLQEMLQDAGYEAAAAPSTDSALRYLDVCKAIDVLLVDVSSGRNERASLCWSARRSHPLAAILVMSTLAVQNQQAFPQGTRFLTKPFTERDLLNTIAAARGPGAS
jgi:CheY-like chemotaxis protein